MAGYLAIVGGGGEEHLKMYYSQSCKRQKDAVQYPHQHSIHSSFCFKRQLSKFYFNIKIMQKGNQGTIWGHRCNIRRGQSLKSTFSELFILKRESDCFLGELSKF